MKDQSVSDIQVKMAKKHLMPLGLDLVMEPCLDQVSIFVSSGQGRHRSKLTSTSQLRALFEAQGRLPHSRVMMPPPPPPQNEFFSASKDVSNEIEFAMNGPELEDLEPKPGTNLGKPCIFVKRSRACQWTLNGLHLKCTFPFSWVSVKGCDHYHPRHFPVIMIR